MLERARIHRAMLRLEAQGAFAASDVVRETGALLATVRKNLDRDAQLGWLKDIGTQRSGAAGRPEKLYRFSHSGRRSVRTEIEEAYSALMNAAPPEPPAVFAAAKETLRSLQDPKLPSRLFVSRLRVAAAQLTAAAEDSTADRSLIKRLLTTVTKAMRDLQDQDADPGLVSLRVRLAKELEAIERLATESTSVGIVARLASALLPQLREFQRYCRGETADLVRRVVGALAPLAINSRHDVQNNNEKLWMPDLSALDHNTTRPLHPSDRKLRQSQPLFAYTRNSTVPFGKPDVSEDPRIPISGQFRTITRSGMYGHRALELDRTPASYSLTEALA
jgi:hypothetical protein